VNNPHVRSPSTSFGCRHTVNVSDPFAGKKASGGTAVRIACTGASSIQVAPTFGKEAKLGTDPWSFAAPTTDGRPFLLDMATTTVAAGRIRKANEGLPCPPGWVLNQDGLPSTDPLEAGEKGGSSPRSAARRRTQATRGPG
jgi:LDH2 family malate/lactate/ureidoglycolate dehydrogenase